jgi:hypothetical protein
MSWELGVISWEGVMSWELGVMSYELGVGSRKFDFEVKTQLSNF